MYTRTIKRTIYPGDNIFNVIDLSHNEEFLRLGIADMTDSVDAVECKQLGVKLSRKKNGHRWGCVETKDFCVTINPDTGMARVINSTPVPVNAVFKVTLINFNRRNNKLSLKSRWKMFLINRK